MIIERSWVFESGLAALTQVGPHLGVDSHNMAKQAGGLEKLLGALVALVQLLLVVHLSHVPVESEIGAVNSIVQQCYHHGC